MWVSSRIVEWFGLNVENVRDLQGDLKACQAERDMLRNQLLISQTNFDWARMKLNQLEAEKTALMEKAFNIKIPAPEIVRSHSITHDPFVDESIFEDMGEEKAKKLGLPMYQGSST